MREYDVTPREQGSNCIYQRDCQFYKFGIYCNHCNEYEGYEEIEITDESDDITDFESPYYF